MVQMPLEFARLVAFIVAVAVPFVNFRIVSFQFFQSVCETSSIHMDSVHHANEAFPFSQFENHSQSQQHDKFAWLLALVVWQDSALQHLLVR